ncbi:MAG: hypothetical protein A4S09_15320 [Proteobacteria bacterium SG_bin7]|nr:MAG: hypothetical protein A4S09_15320 [Proteobacteria bacterium SG_bin7]
MSQNQIVTIIVSLALSSIANGHAKLSNNTFQPKATFNSPLPRTNSDSAKLQSHPCGGVEKSATTPITDYEIGKQISVEWEETIDHNGYYLLDLSKDNGVTWIPLKNPLGQNIGQVTDTPGNVNQGNPATYHRYTQNVVLPSETCPSCILRMRQFMEGRPNDPYYFSCADIRILATTPPPPPVDPMPPAPPPASGNNGGNTSQSSTANNGGAKFSSCGIINNSYRGGGLPPGTTLAIVTLFLFPLLLLQALRPERARRRKNL